MAEEKKDVAVAKREVPGITFTGKDGELSANVEVAIADVKKYLCPKASDSELYMFVNIARSQGLNPFKREIYFVPFNDKQTGETKHSIVVGYEVYLKRALASGQCEGFKVEYLDAGLDTERAKVTINRKGWTMPFEWEAERRVWDKKRSSWNFMPQHLTKKTALSQGFRLCFADYIDGMPYTHEEIEAGGVEVQAEFTASDDKPAKETGSISLDDLTKGEVPVEPPTPIVEKLKEEFDAEGVEPEIAVPWDQIKKIPLANLTEQNVLDVVNMLNYPLTGADPKGIRKMLPKYLKAAIEKLEAWEKEGAK
jgi:phage recombination protein Bet